jgi:SAM-dependent methyltransferase
MPAAASESVTVRQLGLEVRRRFAYDPDAVPNTLINGQYACVHRALSSCLTPPADILDFGAGFGDIPLFATLMGHRCEAADDLQDSWHSLPGARENILRVAAEAGIPFTIIRDGQELPWGPDRFDMVMLHHVLEHLHDSPRPLLTRLLESVKPGGHLFITVPNAGNLRKRLDLLRGRTNLPAYADYFWSSVPYRAHVREYVRGDLECLTRFLGLEPRMLGSYHSMLHVIPPRFRGVYSALTSLMPGTRDSWYMLARKPADWRPPTAPS